MVVEQLTFASGCTGGFWVDPWNGFVRCFGFQGAFVVCGLLSFVLGALEAFGSVFGQLIFVPRVFVVSEPLTFILEAQVASGSVFETLIFVTVGSGGRSAMRSHLRVVQAVSKLLNRMVHRRS